MFYKIDKRDMVLVLPMELAQEVNGAHFPSSHSAPKQGKEADRLIIDPSNGDEGVPVLNGKDVKEAAIRRWGEMTLPTIVTIMVQFVEFKNATGRLWEDIQLWKMDLKGASTPDVIQELELSTDRYGTARGVGDDLLVWYMWVDGYTHSFCSDFAGYPA